MRFRGSNNGNKRATFFFRSFRIDVTMNRRIMTKTTVKERVTITGGTRINGQRRGEVRRDVCMQGEVLVRRGVIQ